MSFPDWLWLSVQCISFGFTYRYSQNHGTVLLLKYSPKYEQVHSTKVKICTIYRAKRTPIPESQTGLCQQKFWINPETFMIYQNDVTADFCFEWHCIIVDFSHGQKWNWELHVPYHFNRITSYKKVKMKTKHICVISQEIRSRIDRYLPT